MPDYLITLEADTPMTHKSLFSGLVLFALMLSIAACSVTQTPAPATPSRAVQTARPTALSTATGAPNMKPTVPASPEVIEQATSSAPGQGLTRVDSQGAVEFAVTPLNLTAPGETLDFDISLNTHSADLSWNLAAQSILTTDTGLEVKGSSWPVGGGHHYDGTLTFPAKTADGKSLLEGAGKLTLTIREAGAASRVFEWDLAR
jgi:hypothetical protein